MIDRSEKRERQEGTKGKETTVKQGIMDKFYNGSFLYGMESVVIGLINVMEIVGNFIQLCTIYSTHFRLARSSRLKQLLSLET